MTDVQPYLEKIVERVSVPAIQTSLKGFSKSLLFRFTDTGEEYLIRFVDGKEAVLSHETLAKPDLTVITSSDTLAGVMDKKINGMTAYMQRKIQTKGAIEDLMKLQKLML